MTAIFREIVRCLRDERYARTSPARPIAALIVAALFVAVLFAGSLRG